MTRLLLVGVLLATVALGGDRKKPSAKTAGSRYTWALHGIEFDHTVPRGYDARKGADLLIALSPRTYPKNAMALGWLDDDGYPAITVEIAGKYTGRRLAWHVVDKDPEVDLARMREFVGTLRSMLKIDRVFVAADREAALIAGRWGAQFPGELAGVLFVQPGPEAEEAVPPKLRLAVVHHVGSEPTGTAGNTAAFPFAHARTIAEATKDRSRLFVVNSYPPTLSESVRRALAWCGGMQAEDERRILEAVDDLARVNDDTLETDFGALYELAGRLAGRTKSKRVRGRMKRLRASIEKTAALHAKALKRKKVPPFSKDAWIGHLPRFLDAFVGVPAREAVAERWRPVVAAQEQAARPLVERFFADQKKPGPFETGLLALRAGYLTRDVQGTRFRFAMVHLGKHKDLDTFAAAWEAGRLAFAKANRKFER